MINLTIYMAGAQHAMKTHVTHVLLLIAWMMLLVTLFKMMLMTLMPMLMLFAEA